MLCQFCKVCATALVAQMFIDSTREGGGKFEKGRRTFGLNTYPMQILLKINLAGSNGQLSEQPEGMNQSLVTCGRTEIVLGCFRTARSDAVEIGMPIQQ